MLEYIISYLLGSINFCWIIGKLLKVDLSKSEDENLGALNLYSSLKNQGIGRKAIFYAIIGGLLDALKAYIPTILFGPLAGVFAVIGHCFSIFSIVITKKIPSGVGEASVIGFFLATYKRTFIFFVFYFLVSWIISLLFLVRNYQVKEKLLIFSILHSSEIYSKSIAILLFFLTDFHKVDKDILRSIIILTISVLTARMLRFKNIYIKLVKKWEKS